MASADPARVATADVPAAGAILSPAAFLQRDTSTARRRTPPANAELWSTFGSIATDRQRINLRLRLPGEDNARVYHAGELLEAASGAAPEGAPRPEPVDRLAPALRILLDAAESLRPWHRTRIYLGAGSAPVPVRDDCVVLDWRRVQSGQGPAVEVIGVDAFASGRWTGPQRIDDGRYALAVQSTAAACARVQRLMTELATGQDRLSVVVRTFDPG